MQQQGKVPLEKVDLRLAVTEVPPPGSLPVPIKCRFPKHNDSTASMMVYPGHITCYGCNSSIRRRMEALAFLLGFEDALGGLDWRRAIEVAGKYVVDSLDAYREVAAREARKDPMPRAYAEVFHSMLRGQFKERNEWLYARGFEGRTLQAFLIGHNGSQFTIPFFNSWGEVITIRFRRDDKIATSYFEPKDGKEHDIPKYSGITGRNGLYLYADWMLDNPHIDYVVVTESELCAARLWQEGIPAVSPTNGASQLKHVARLLEPYPHIKKLWVASDQDDAGYEGAKELIRNERGLPAYRLNWEREWGKDVTELLCGGHRLEECGFNEQRRFEEVLDRDR